MTPARESVMPARPAPLSLSLTLYRLSLSCLQAQVSIGLEQPACDDKACGARGRYKEEMEEDMEEGGGGGGILGMADKSCGREWDSSG